MANIFTTHNTVYTPMSYEELVAPFIRYKENFDKDTNTLSEYQSNAEKWRKIAEGEAPNDEGYTLNMWNSYNNHLNDIADELMTKGRTMNTIPNILSLKKRYNSEILPIESAYAKREAMKDYELKNPNYIYQRRANDISLKDIIQHPDMNYTQESIDLLHQKAVQDFSAFKTAFNKDRSNGYKGTGLSFFYEALKQSGATVDDANDVLNGKKNNKFQEVLSAVSDYIYNGSNIANWKPDVYRNNYAYENEKNQARNIINSAVGNALGNADYRSHYDQYGATAALKAKENADKNISPAPYTSENVLEKTGMAGWNEALKKQQEDLETAVYGSTKHGLPGTSVKTDYYTNNRDTGSSITGSKLKIYDYDEDKDTSWLSFGRPKDGTKLRLLNFDKFYDENVKKYTDIKSNGSSDFENNPFLELAKNNTGAYSNLFNILGLSQRYNGGSYSLDKDKLEADTRKIAKFVYKEMLYDKFGNILSKDGENKYLVTKDNIQSGEKVGDIRDSIIDDVDNEMTVKPGEEIVDKNGNTILDAGDRIDIESYYKRKHNELEQQKDKAFLRYIKYRNAENWNASDIVTKGFARYPNFIKPGEDNERFNIREIKGWDKKKNDLLYGDELFDTAGRIKKSGGNYEVLSDDSSNTGFKFNTVGLTPDMKNIIMSFYDEGQEKWYGIPLDGDNGLITEEGTIRSLIDNYRRTYEDFKNKNISKQINELVSLYGISPAYASYIAEQKISENLAKMSDAIFNEITKKLKTEDTKQ